MAENDKFETIGDAYAKYPQSTLVMRKQYVDELNARIAQLEDDNALLKRNNENLRIDKKEIEQHYRNNATPPIDFNIGYGHKDH